MKTVNNQEVKLFSTLPQTEQERWALMRAKQITDFKWKPVREIPTYCKIDNTVGNTVLPENKEITGFLYSGLEWTDKFLAENVSFETFISCIANPDSTLYQPGYGKFNTPNYGIVCNGLVRYALGINRRFNTAKWLTIPGMTLVAKHGEYTADDIRLLDVPWAYGEGRNHVEIVTDLIKDENGKVVKIELSGAVRPYCKRRTFTVEEYFEQFKLFSLTRYDLSLVPKLDEDVYKLVLETPVNYTRPKIAVDNGNKSNYLAGDITLISACVDGEDTIKVYKDGELLESTKIYGIAKLPRKFERGYYKVQLENNGDMVEFCVCQAEISHVVNGDEITITANPCDANSEFHYVDFRYAGSKDYQLKGSRASSMESAFDLTEEEKTSGIITRKFSSDAENFKVYFKNKYGVWVHTMTKIK